MLNIKARHTNFNTIIWEQIYNFFVMLRLRPGIQSSYYNLGIVMFHSNAVLQEYDSHFLLYDTKTVVIAWYAY